MAKLSLDLSQFTAAGVYTIEFDQTERVVVSTQSLRLLPGFSKSGPFNAPVFIRSTKDLQKFYGDRDKKLERKGSFFHLSLETALLQSPVFAINLLKVDDSPSDPSIDTAQGITLSVNSNVDNKTIYDGKPVFTDKFVNYFNRERFWKSDPEYLFGVAKNKEGVTTDSAASLIQVANVGTKTLSFIIQKAATSGYDVFARDWYGSEDNIPFDWIRPYDKIADYFIQVIAVEGNWDNYLKLAGDPYYSDYFTTDGIKPEMLNQFINSPNVNLAGSWTGTFIPDFLDQTGSNQYIEDIVNASTQLTGILINVNKDALDQLIWDETTGTWVSGDGTTSATADILVDLVGHDWIDVSTGVSNSFLSYDVSVSEAILHTDITLEVGSLNTITGKVFEIDPTDTGNISIGSLVAKDSSDGTIPGVTYVISKVYTDTSTYKLETAEAILGFADDAPTVLVQRPVTDPSVSDHLLFHVTRGLKINANHLPGYTDVGAPNLEEGVKKVYGMLEDPGIQRGLLNPDMIQYRYVVDTMGNGLQPELGGKFYLSRLAKKRGMTTALISAPSIKQFSTSQDPYFCDVFVSGVDPKPVFNTMYIPEGGNPDMPRSWKFSLPTEDNGGKYCGVFGPFLTYVEGGTTYSVPPAADVSNSYIKKFLGGDPYAIVANQYGILANPYIGGLEYMLDKTDRGYMEKIGYNSIIERIGTGQIMIYSNSTSYQTVKSDYNKLHVRELLNTIELEVDSVLQQYVFQYNNPVMRLNVVNSVLPILQNIQDAGAIEKYELVMDESNNTPDITDDGFAIIDIGVWINKGMEKIINRITVNRNTGTSSGGFTAV